MTTPFEMRLESELDVEFARFANNWLFSWHNINIPNRLVDVEDFQGGRFHTGGVVFQGQIQQMYWQAIGRYLDQQIHRVFHEWEVASKSYSLETKKQSLEGVARILKIFVTRVLTRATATDRAIRGEGFPDRIQPYNSSGTHSGANAKIHGLKKAHLGLISEIAALPEPSKPEFEKSRRQRLEDWYANNKFLTWFIGLAVAILGVLAKAFLF